MADDRVVKLRPAQAKLIDRAVEIQERNVLDRDELGFSTRVFVQCGLPHRDPGNGENVWGRRNGDFSLLVQPGWGLDDKSRPVCYGYPFGNIPRLLLFYICTQVIQTKSQEISLGGSLSEFMRSIDLEVTGGRWGTISRFKDQTWRLFNASISFAYESDSMKAVTKANIANKIQLWWNPKHPDQQSLFNSYIALTKEFFEEILAHPVPVDMGIVAVIKQSPLALDLYTWLTHRVVYLNKPIRISWVSLAGQIGSEYSETRNFMTKAKEAFSKIRALWPELKIEEVRGGIKLHPSKPSVPVKLLT